jgi:WD40 repeat protein
MQLLTVPRDKPLRLAFSPDGRLLAGGGGQAFHLWDLSAGPQPCWSLKKSDLALSFAITPDGSDLFGGSYGAFARYDLRTGHGAWDMTLSAFNPSTLSPCGRFGVAVGVHRDHRTLRLCCAALGADARAELWRHDTALDPEGVVQQVRQTACDELWRKEIAFNPAHEPAGCRVLLFAADGSRLVRVAGCSPRNKQNLTASSIEVWDTLTGEAVATWVGDLPYYATSGAVSPKGVVALINGRALHVIDAAAHGNSPAKHVNPSPKPLEMVAFTADGSRLASVGRDAVATVWDATTWEVRKRYEWGIGPLRSVCFARDGLRCAAGGDKQIVVWDLDD